MIDHLPVSHHSPGDSAGKCGSDQSEIGPVRDYGAEYRLCSSKSKIPKGACSVEKTNIGGEEKERGSGEKTTFVAKMSKTLAKKMYHCWMRSESITNAWTGPQATASKLCEHPGRFKFAWPDASLGRAGVQQFSCMGNYSRSKGRPVIWNP